MFVFCTSEPDDNNTLNGNRRQRYCFFLNYANVCTTFLHFFEKKVHFA